MAAIAPEVWDRFNATLDRLTDNMESSGRLVEELDVDARPSDLLDLPDDVCTLDLPTLEGTMTDEEFVEYDAWVSEQEREAGMSEADQNEFDKVWELL